MSSRDRFLERLSSALGRSSAQGVGSVDPPHAVGPPEQLDDRVSHIQELTTRDADNLMDILSRVAETAGWNVARVENAHAAGQYIVEVARDLEARSVVYSQQPAVLSALGDDLFGGTGIKATPIALASEAESVDADGQRAAFRSAMADADIGITGVDYAIAETGTCVIVPRAGTSRLVSLLPPVHIALVERGQVLPSLDELFTLRRADFIDGDFGSYMNLITGPSRSADIEYTLVTGVHGPGEVHMVLIG